MGAVPTGAVLAGQVMGDCALRTTRLDSTTRRYDNRPNAVEVPAATLKN